MIKRARNFVYKRTARLIFGNDNIAAHSLRFAGSVAGRIDNFARGRIRGWIYDQARPNQPIKLKIAINNSVVDEVFANIYRGDIAKLVNNDGLNGFEIDISKHLSASGASMIIDVSVADKPSYKLGPITVFAEMYSLTRDHDLHDNMHPSMNYSTIQRIQQIASRFSENIAETQTQLEHIRKILSTEPEGSPCLDWIGPSASALAHRSNEVHSRSSIAGIGVFDDGILDYTAEVRIMTARIERHLCDAMRNA